MISWQILNVSGILVCSFYLIWGSFIFWFIGLFSISLPRLWKLEWRVKLDELLESAWTQGEVLYRDITSFPVCFLFLCIVSVPFYLLLRLWNLEGGARSYTFLEAAWKQKVLNRGINSFSWLSFLFVCVVLILSHCLVSGNWNEEEDQTSYWRLRVVRERVYLGTLTPFLGWVFCFSVLLCLSSTSLPRVWKLEWRVRSDELLEAACSWGAILYRDTNFISIVGYYWRKRHQTVCWMLLLKNKTSDSLLEVPSK